MHTSGGPLVKNPPANAGDTDLVPALGRSLGEGNGTPLQYSCLGNPVDRGAWWATVHGVAETWLSGWACTHRVISKRGRVRPGLSASRTGVLCNHLAEAGRNLQSRSPSFGPRLCRSPVFTASLLHASILDPCLTSHPWFSIFCLFHDLSFLRTSYTLHLRAPYIKDSDKYKSKRWSKKDETQPCLQ